MRCGARSSISTASSVYPTTAGLDALREAMAAWFVRRYGLPRARSRHAGAAGQRHARGALRLRAGGRSTPRARSPLVVCPNPFYQIYEGAALLAGAEPAFLNQTRRDGFDLDLDSLTDDQWARDAAAVRLLAGQPDRARADSRRVARALRAAPTATASSSRPTSAIRRSIRTRPRRRSAALEAAHAPRPRPTSATSSSSPACRSARTRRACDRAPSPATRRC